MIFSLNSQSKLLIIINIFEMAVSLAPIDAMEIVYVPLVNLLGANFIKLFQQKGLVDIS